MASEIKALGYSEMRIEEYDRDGSLSVSKNYIGLKAACKRLINHAQGEFPIYQGSEVMYMGYKMKIVMN